MAYSIIYRQKFLNGKVQNEIVRNALCDKIQKIRCNYKKTSVFTG